MLKSHNTALSVSLFLIGLMFFVPFANLHHQMPIVWFYSEWLAAALGLIAIIPLLKTSFLQDNSIPQSSLVFAGLSIILIIQHLLGMLHSTRYALMVLSYLVWAGLLTLLGSHLRRELGWEKLATTLAWALTASGIVNVMILVLQFIAHTGGNIPLLPNLGSNGALLQANHQADLCALAIASLIYLYAKEQFSVSFCTLFYSFFLIALSFSGSRSSWLYLFAITTLTIVIAYQQKARPKGIAKNTRNITYSGLMLLPAFAVSQLLIHYIAPSELVSLPTERFLESISSSSTSARLHIWYDSLRLFLQSPWLGIGSGGMQLHTFLLFDKHSTLSANMVFEHAHNLFLHLAAEMGVFALLIVSASLIVWIRHFKWREIDLEAWWLVSLLMVLGIHSMLEYPLWFTYFLGIGAILLGAGDEKLVSIRLPAFAKKLGIKSGQKLVQSSLLLALLFGVANIGTSFIANNKMESWLANLTEENSRETAALEWVRQYSFLSAFAELLVAYVSPIDTSDLDQKLTLNKSAMRFRATSKVVYHHAILLELKGDHTSAISQLNRALLAYPNYYQNMLENTPAEYKKVFINLLLEVRPALKDKLPSASHWHQPTK